MPDIPKLFKTHYKLLFRIIYAYTQNIEDTKDVLQDTFIRAFKGYRSDIPEDKLLPWIIVIAKNTAKTFIKRQNVYRITGEIADFAVQNEPDFLEFMLHESISACLLTIPDDLRDLLKMNLVDSVPLKKVARVSNVPYSTLRYWQSRLFHDLKHLIRE